MRFILLLIIFGVFKDICHGCDAGYYFDSKQCQRCPNNCFICSSVTSCTVCKVGKYGTDCSSSCPKHCHDNVCNINSGICLSCEKGYYRDENNSCVPCPYNCTTCSSDNYCFACKNGFRGVICNETCNNCQYGTACDKNSGYCFMNCREGLSGELCNSQCDAKCKSCERLNEHECISCTDDENSKPCKIQCLNRCLKSSCNESGESGDREEHTRNITCVSYCKDTVCNITSNESPTESPSSSTSTTNIGVILGPVIGSIVMVVIIGVCIILVRRFSTKRSSSYNTSDDKMPVRSRTPKTNDVEKNELLATWISDTRKIKPAQKFTILHQQGNFRTIEKKYGNMQIRVVGNEVTIEGNQADVENVFKIINTECNKITQVNFEHSKTKEWSIFSQEEQTVQYVQAKLEQKQLIGCWDIKDTVLTVYVPDKNNGEQIKNILFESILEKSVQVEESSSHLLSSEWWADFLEDTRKKFMKKVDIFTKGMQAVVILGRDEVVPDVIKLVEEFLKTKTEKIVCQPTVWEFISECWTEDDFEEIRTHDVLIKTKENIFELRGLPDNMTKGMEILNKKLNQMCSKPYKMTGTGIITVLETAKQSGTLSDIAKECKCVIKLPEEIDGSISVLNDHEVIDSEIMIENQQDSNTNASPVCFQTRRHNIKIKLIRGELVQQKVDIIVVGAAGNLELESGSAFFSLFNQGGPKLQKDYKRLYPNGIQDGDVAVIDSEKCSCQKIFVTSLPSWEVARRNGGKVLRNCMRECLRLADKYDKKTIAFSSTVRGGHLAYPIDMAVSIMYGAVVEFDSSYSNTSLKTIKIVMCNEDEKTIKAFKDHEHMRLHGVSSGGSLSSDFVGGTIKIELVTGDISTQEVDSILCSVTSNMDLTSSAFCEYLVKNGGDSLNDECEQKYKNTLDVGKVVEISGGNLPCKTVFLTVLPAYTESNIAEQNLITTLQEVFQQANTNGYKSLAIPALGTDYLNYPKTKAAKCMYDATIDWANKNPNANLKIVRFVMYSNDTEAQQAYKMCHLKTKGREARDKRSFFGKEIFINPDEDSKFMMVKDGCKIGPIQLKVEAADLLNNVTDAILIGVDSNFDMKEHDLEKHEVVITDSAETKVKYLIHVPFQDSLTAWRGKLVNCLEEAGRKSVHYVAFLILEKGAGPSKRFVADSIAECLFAAIDDFTSRNIVSSVTDVRLVVDDRNAGCIPAIIAALQARITAVSFQWGIGKLFKSQLGSVVESYQFQEVTIHSDAIINIDRCIETLEDRIKLAYTEKVVDADMDDLSSFEDKQISIIIDSDIMVDVTFNKEERQFTVVGPLRNVIAAVSCLHHNIRHYKREKNSLNYATILYEQTKWHWLRKDLVASEEDVPYDMMPNFILETAYKDGKETVELKSKNGKIYVIDFQKMIEYPKLNVHDYAMVIRRNILKDVRQDVNLHTGVGLRRILYDVKIHETGWDAFKSTFKGMLPIADSTEKIKKRFLTEVKNGRYPCNMHNIQSVQVITIEAIENSTLYEQYTAKKKMMEQEKSGYKEIERKLWHETAEESIDRIVIHGFNRSYCGVHGDSYGQGVYFASDASHCAQSFFAENKPGAIRYMFLASVLTGKFTKGNSSMRVLPLVDPAHPKVMYDSAVDNVDQPMQFVIFHDKQALPQYLITYIIKDAGSK